MGTTNSRKLKYGLIIILQSESSESESPNDGLPHFFGALAKAQALLTWPGKSTKLGRKASKEEMIHGRTMKLWSGRLDGKITRDFNRSSKHAPQRKYQARRQYHEGGRSFLSQSASIGTRDSSLLVGQVDESEDQESIFLDEYREDEMKELKEAIKTTKDEGAEREVETSADRPWSREEGPAREGQGKGDLGPA